MGDQLAKDQDDGRGQILGTYHDADAINARLRQADRDDRYHLVAPATSAQPPEGCGVNFSLVKIDPATETYPLPGGKLGLDKTALNRIAAAAGVCWLQGERCDDSSDPRYCRYYVLGRYRQLDGTWIQISAEKEVDLRDGSAQVEEILLKAKSTAKGEQALRGQRMHILSMAETKAKLRAIRSIGVRTSYDKRELDKPFVVPRIAFTGQTDDPELRRVFAEKTADAFLGATTALYGDEGQRPVLGRGAQLVEAHAPPPAARFVAAHNPPPPVGSVPLDVEDGLEEPVPPAIDLRARGATVNTPGFDPGDAGSTPAAPTPAVPEQEITQVEQPVAQEQANEGPPKLPNGQPIETADTKELAWWVDRLEEQVEAGQSRPGDGPRLDAMKSEINRRAAAERPE